MVILGQADCCGYRAAQRQCVQQKEQPGGHWGLGANLDWLPTGCVALGKLLGLSGLCSCHLAGMSHGAEVMFVQPPVPSSYRKGHSLLWSVLPLPSRFFTCCNILSFLEAAF